ncbi:hypothetical protein [uncultured Aquitalea sp.]|uniref:hypothetical protein n=1 Tax=uncultured Aquitalea sp. TaxID=540272 RepID=UPI0025D76DE0|nr:hypothetical protein [uncultured Aquitalea sp.]
MSRLTPSSGLTELHELLDGLLAEAERIQPLIKEQNLDALLQELGRLEGGTTELVSWLQARPEFLDDTLKARLRQLQERRESLQGVLEGWSESLRIELQSLSQNQRLQKTYSR